VNPRAVNQLAEDEALQLSNPQHLVLKSTVHPHGPRVVVAEMRGENEGVEGLLEKSPVFKELLRKI
jgi:hypothetical protein